jgi:RHS repeat-associated protein
VLKDRDHQNAPPPSAPGPDKPEDRPAEPSNNAQEPRAASLSLPKGGGAIKGIGEKFNTNAVTGTGTMSVPLPTSRGRSGFGPQLSLSYDSGSGNGPFGFGWSLSLPSITRKTDKGLPQYLDQDESDVFLLSGAEDLVPVLVETVNGWEREQLPNRIVDGEEFRIQRYRPRIEGLFSRIERWTNLQDGDVHWRSITRDNVTTLYGKDDNSRLFAPADALTGHPKRIFSWLICESFDDKGNAIVYDYAGENDENVDVSQVNERNRSREANRYLRSIKYGNRVSRLIEPDLDLAQWLFEVVFDYDEGRYEPLPPDPNLPEAEQHEFVRAALAPGQSWTIRPDPFSAHRAAFEVRAYRRCHRVLMFHRFPELGAEPCLVRATEFDYADLDYSLPTTIEQELAHQGSTRFASFVRRMAQSGFVRDATKPVETIDGVNFVTYLKKSLPPLEFVYSKAQIQEDIRELNAVSAENVPAGIDGRAYQWIDLNGEGLSGILAEHGGTWFYKPNLGNGKFGPAQIVPSQPSMSDLSGGRQQVLDLAGDGQLDIVTFAGPTPGFFERTDDEDWTTFKAFKSLPNVQWNEPNLRFIDLTGDGHADILITEDEVFTWYPSLAEDGFDSAVQLRKSFDEERGPRLVLADGTQSIYLADMCGDGLTDLVRVRNGEICYWPNLGYGRFGAKVIMDNAPWFDATDAFSQQRVRLADIDGSGATDIIYLGRDRVSLFFNQSGNRWTEARPLTQFPPVDNLSTISTIDLLGNGTVCIVWGSPLSRDAAKPVRYIDLMGHKPHLLVETINNLGAETRVEYASSTKFYLADKEAGKPRIAKAPFPVHVVERVETYDRIGGNRFVTRYDYHHGYFDGTDREFRGFGLVEQRDTEEFAALNANQTFPAGTNIDETSHIPPVLTRTWFHTGVYLSREHVSDFFAGLGDDRDVGEYYREPGLTDDQARALLLDDTILPDALTVEEEREACRALKGSMLRQEIYALDGSAQQAHPYVVTEQNFTVEVVQPQAENEHAVVFTHPREVITYHYEREPADPRVTHALTLEVDEFGNVLKAVKVAYGRRQNVTVIDGSGDVQVIPNPGLAQLSVEDQAKQTATLITYNESEFTNPIDEDDDYRARLISDARTYELTGLVLPSNQPRFTFDEILTAANDADSIDYEQPPTSGVQEKRLIEHVRTIYRRNDLTGPLALHQLESPALPFHVLKLAFTPGLVTNLFAGRVTNQILEDECRYVHSEGDNNWWSPSAREFYSPNPLANAAQERAEARSHFFLPRRYRDPFHTNVLSTESTVTYDTHDLLVLETRDALGNRVTAGERDAGGNLTSVGNDYRVLQPRLLTDPNRNRSAVAFDALGMVAGAAVMGKLGALPQQGDLVDTTFRADLTMAEIEQFFANPTGPIASVLLDKASSRSVYDLTAYWREPDPQQKPPTFAATISRETHFNDPVPPNGLAIQTTFSYTDGLGREIQKKGPAEPGPAPQRDVNGKIIVDVNGQPVMTAGDVNPRWIGSGWTVFNNKGKPVRQYEPYFTDTHRFEFDVRIGVSPVLCYDAAGRVVATLHPNRTWEKVLFNSWRQESWDLNDTVLIAAPQSDAAVGDFFARLPASEYLPTWHGQRAGGALGPLEQSAAEKSAIHAATPTVAHFDSLGRPFLMIKHNKFQHSNAPQPVEEFYEARIAFDIEGKQLQLRDPVIQNGDLQGRAVMNYDYNVLGELIHQTSIDAGARWLLNDAASKPLYSWDSKNNRIRTDYDQLRRATGSFLRPGVGNELLVMRTVYGESDPNPEPDNKRAKAIQVFDQAGVISNTAFDFKGNLLRTQRQLAQEYRTALNWSAAVPLEAEVFTNETAYDALNRPTTEILPDNTAIRHHYNQANLLESIDANLQGEIDITTIVTSIDYDAKGQRKQIVHGNGVRTTYAYDPRTLEVVRLLTERSAADFPDDCPQPPIAGWPGCEVQDLHYVYDPSGNVTHIHDDAQQQIYFRNKRVEPSTDYTYDAIYRLIEVTGREHLGQVGGTPSPGSYNDRSRIRILLSTSDGNAVGTYLERYLYDAVGNPKQVIHQGNDPVSPGWTRTYFYADASPLEAGKQSNRLTSTTVGGTTETYSVAGDGYDAHGNMLRMPQLQAMQWDFKDYLHMTQRQAVNVDDVDGAQHAGQRTWYVYDSDGRRVRKVTDAEVLGGQTPVRIEERVYVGNLFESYREYESDGVTVDLERDTVHVSDNKQRIAIIEMRTEGDEPQVPPRLIRYQFGNHLGSVSLDLDQQARIISYEEYYPYGSTSFQAVGSQTETNKRYRYTGKERDEESGLYYHGARYYAAWLARWTSTDPAGPTDSLSLYVYVAANPTTLHDPTGHQAKKGALTVSPNSQISAKEFVAMMQRNDKLTPWMKSVFKAEGNKIVVDTTKLNQVPQGAVVPQWFKNAIFAVQIKEWHVTTGTTILKETKGKTTMGERLIADLEPGDKPIGAGVTEGKGLALGETIASESMKSMDQTTNFARKMPDSTAGGEEKGLRRKAGQGTPSAGLIVISNRGQVAKDSPEVEKRSEANILETFFHELAAHAALDSQGKNSEHSKMSNWRVAPITESDILAKAVADFFGTKETLQEIPPDAPNAVVSQPRSGLLMPIPWNACHFFFLNALGPPKGFECKR